MLTKQYTVLLIFPLSFRLMQASQPEFVTPIGRDMYGADTEILSDDGRKRLESDDLAGAVCNLQSRFEESDTAVAEDGSLSSAADAVQPWLEQAPSVLRPIAKARLVSSVESAQRQIGKMRTGSVDSLIALCKTVPGNGEWALYYTVIHDASDLFKKVLELGYSYRVIFPVDGKKAAVSHEPTQTEGLLISALRLRRLEHARILIDSVKQFSFFNEQVQLSCLCDDDWNRVVETLEELRGRAGVFMDDDLAHLCTYLIDLIKRKQLGVVRYYALSMYHAVRQDLYEVSSRGKPVAFKLLRYAPWIGIAGLIGMLVIREMRSAYIYEREMAKIGMLFRAPSCCPYISGHT